MKDTKEVEIPEELFAELTERVEADENFETVEELVIFLLKNNISKEKIQKEE